MDPNNIQLSTKCLSDRYNTAERNIQDMLLLAIMSIGKLKKSNHVISKQ